MSTIVSVIIWLAVGAVIGLIASSLMGGSLGLIWCIILGIVGSLLGGWISSLLGISGGWIVNAIFSLIGACIVLLIARLFRRAA